MHSNYNHAHPPGVSLQAIRQSANASALYGAEHKVLASPGALLEGTLFGCEGTPGKFPVACPLVCGLVTDSLFPGHRMALAGRLSAFQ
jgi:hypothetical protein